MDSVNKTLFIPLYGKALVSRKGILLKDEKAEEIWGKEGFSLKGKSKSKWLAYYMAMRARVFDDWVKEKIQTEQTFVVLHIGCGLDSRAERVGNSSSIWVDVDFSEVIELRKKYYFENERYQMLGADVRELAWIDELPTAKKAVVVLEGVSMYLADGEFKGLLNAIAKRYEQADFLVDCYTTLAAKLSKYKNPVNDVGVTKVYGIDDPLSVCEGGITMFVAERDITPDTLIEQLQGLEKSIFKRLYAGGVAKKMYKLYEYKKHAL